MSKKSEFTGWTRSATRAGTRVRPSPKAKTAASNVSRKPVPRETRVVVHPPGDPALWDTAPDETPLSRTRSSPLVYEAMEKLRISAYLPIRLIEPGIPINLIGLRSSGSLLICALRSRQPVPSAARLREIYSLKVDYLCALAGKVKDRIMIWVYSPSCGWRYYRVYPGGLRYDLDFPKSIE